MACAAGSGGGIAVWRRSLQLRVVATTTVFSLVAIMVLGNILITEVRDGLLDAKVQASLAEASTGARTSQEAFDSADRSEPGVYDTLVPDLVRQLSSGGGPDGARDVVLLRGPDVDTPESPLGRSSIGADVSAVRAAAPAGRRPARSSWTYGEVSRTSGRQVPVVVVGSPVVVPRTAPTSCTSCSRWTRSRTPSGWSGARCCWPPSAWCSWSAASPGW